MLAVLCAVLAIVPFLFLLPESILASYIDTKSGIEALIVSPNGTPSFVEDCKHRIVIGVTAFSLDLLCCIGMWCVVGVAFNLLSRCWQLFTWILAIVAGFGSALLRKSMIGSQTDRTFIFMILIIPVVVGTLSLLGLILTALRQETA
jgi:hypothetical protein